MTHDVSHRCAFDTDRLEVGDWHDLASLHGIDLAATVSTILNAKTTAALPPDWHGDFDRARAQRWIGSRDDESPTRLVVERSTGLPVGLLILFEARAERERTDLVDLRLGYVLDESRWGRGLASELVLGLIEWARTESSIASVSGGVAHGNEASARVLVKSGFAPKGTQGDQQIYELVLTPLSP